MTDEQEESTRRPTSECRGRWGGAYVTGEGPGGRRISTYYDVSSGFCILEGLVGGGGGGRGMKRDLKKNEKRFEKRYGAGTERDCLYYIIVQAYDVGLHSRRHPLKWRR